MAQEARDERLLMRQRGAGARNATTLEFDLDLGAGSREERLLMRQRGAGNREVNNIDFGFAFATPVQRSTRLSGKRSKTPTTSTRTPLRRNAEDVPIQVSSARSTRSQHLPAHPTQRSTNGSTGGSQRKRRRLSEVSNITRATSIGLPAGSEIDDLEVLHSEQFQAIPTILDTVPHQQYPRPQNRIPSSPLFFPSPHHDQTEADKENIPTTSEAVKATTKKRKRKSIGQQSLFKKKRSSGSSIIPLPTPPIIDETPQPEEPQVNVSNLPSVHDDSTSLSNAPKELTPISSIPIQPLRATPLVTSNQSKRKKKRKSIVGAIKKRKSSDAVSTIRSSVTPAFEVHRDEEPAIMSDAEHDLDRDSNQTPSIARRRKRGQRPSSSRKDAPQADMHDDDADADETYLPDEKTPEPTPAPKRVKANRKVGQARGSMDGSTTTRKKSGGFPILTHRMTNAHKLPTIFEEVEQDVPDDVDSAADELSLPPPAIVTKSAPNAVDVLAQACRETVESYIRKLKDGPSQLSRADRTRQLTALQTFRSNLDVQLFDLSQSLDQRLHMEARLRKQRREKSELQARWLEVRKQRDRLELRKDAIRRQHWEGEFLSRKAWDISQSAYRLETAVSRDESNMDQGGGADLLEFSLDQLKQDVSLKDGGGILNVLKQFNAQLEQTARALN